MHISYAANHDALRQPGGSSPPDEGQAALSAGVLRLVGDVDITAAGALRRQLDDQMTATRSATVVVDLSAVSFMDCAGLEPLVTADRWLARRDRQLELRSVPAHVARLFANLRRAGCLPLVQESPGLVATRLADGRGRREAGDVDELDAADSDRLQRQGRRALTGVWMDHHDRGAEQAAALLTRVSQQNDVADPRAVAELRPGKQ
ncbi:MAG: STAS domain-containing protein [Actinomycetes bacterium]